MSMTNPLTTILSGDGDLQSFDTSVLTLFLLSPLTVLALRFLQAPYGKLRRPGWGPLLPAPIAWSLMESPTLWLSLLLFPLGRHRSNPLALAVLLLFLLHYTHRTVLYPLRLPKSAAPVPLAVALIAFAFNLLNVYVQIRSVSHYAGYDRSPGLYSWARFGIGALVFFWGMRVNLGADRELLRLKRESGGAYRVPRGGWFELVACPNYFGEAMEWLGWAVAAWTPGSLGFFLYTCANLGPRAGAHLRWYREKFGSEFPANRKAFLPFLY